MAQQCSWTLFVGVEKEKEEEEKGGREGFGPLPRSELKQGGEYKTWVPRKI